jgi:hypothetical protein
VAVYNAHVEVTQMVASKRLHPNADNGAAPHPKSDGGELAGGWQGLIEDDPNRPGPDRVVVVDTGIPVWALIGYLQSLTGLEVDATVAPEAVRRAAADYAIDERLVWAAITYYLDHQQVIDGKLARNAAALV